MGNFRLTKQVAGRNLSSIAAAAVLFGLFVQTTFDLLFLLLLCYTLCISFGGGAGQFV